MHAKPSSVGLDERKYPETGKWLNGPFTAYIDHNSCCLCLDCGGFTDQPTCACGSQALANVARLLDRVVEDVLQIADSSPENSQYDA